MTDEVEQRAKDAEEHKRSYAGIMGAATEIGVPFAMGLSMMFTSLVMANGVLLSILLGVAVYVFSHLIVKMFFSHH
ncbi:hypothetical protein [Hyphococcus sp.]|uniref:hypothetical protein n=1 Tax=Hyphococcus sp. TaxID=2038636 RepID=UPI002089331F|nr:MAG: hypothetical protein DHS20C04_29320 [Marinicaulis sp.]